MKTRVCIISDTHNLHRELQLPAADFLIHCGDFSYRGTDPEVLDFLLWMEEQTSKYRLVFGGFGNHELGPYECMEDFHELRRLYAPNVKWLYLNSFTDKISGLKLFGFPFITPINGRWAFERNSPEMKELAKRIPNDTDILVCHGPPFRILDGFYRKYSIIDPSREEGFRIEEAYHEVGSKELLERIQIVRPKLVCFGHVHEHGSETEEQDGIIYVNAAILDEHYEIAHEPMIVEIGE